MIRFIYWLLAFIEVLLVLGVIILFIITDARSIKYIAETSLDSFGLTYESIEGNLFDGLEIKKLSYDKKPLLSSALVHWNPLTLYTDKLTITKLDAEGIELENIIAMINSIKFEKSESKSSLPFNIVLNNTHFDINSYIYEGVKFSSFLTEIEQIKLSKNLNLNAKKLYLKFDSDIVNVDMKAKIKDSQLLVDTLDLKNISIKDITKLVHRIKDNRDEKIKKTKHNNKNNKILAFKNIKIKHILGTLKATQYGDLKIKGATLHLYNGVVEPKNKFRYQVKKAVFKGLTNFGKLDYKGYIKNSNIYAKGHILLNEELFKKYSLPLNFKGLKKLPSNLHLNHSDVWIDIDHKVENLLKIKNDFNINVSKAKHQLHYNYFDRVFSVDSNVSGNMTYSNTFELKNKVLIDKKGFSYSGNISCSNLKNLPTVISEYLVNDLSGTYKATSLDFEMDLDSNFLMGHLSLPEYKGANLTLKSKSANIELDKFVDNLPLVFQNKKISLDSKSFFDFKNLNQSKINILAQSDILDVDANMKLEQPYEISFNTILNDDMPLREIVPKLNFTKFKYLNGSVKLNDNSYLINLGNKNIQLIMNYNKIHNNIERVVVNFDGQEFLIRKEDSENLIFQTNILDIQKFFEKIKPFYEIEFPNIQGSVDLRIEQYKDSSFGIDLKTPKLQYLSDSGVDISILNFYDIETRFIIDKNFNIELRKYQFRLDDNGYLNSFYSNRVSSLRLDNQNLIVNKLFLNENIEITGNYNIENLQGDLKIFAKQYELSTKDFMIISDLDLSVKLDRERINIEGDIDILGDTITYEVEGSDIVEDSDIIIVENIIREKESAFNNLKLYLKIKSKKPLKYIVKDINVEFMNELSLLKSYNQKMLLTGVTTITKGSYLLEDKLFVLDESHLYFTGDVKKPLLDLKANYKKDEYNVHIFISGTTDAPIVNFNSEPYLTQQEILSLILFDGTGSSSGNGAEAYTLLGGTLAKGLIKSLGIDIIDHILLGTDKDDQLSLEIGTKISNKISVIYLRRDGLNGAKVRIEHSNNFETDIIIQPPKSSSIEFLYQQDR